MEPIITNFAAPGEDLSGTTQCLETEQVRSDQAKRGKYYSCVDDFFIMGKCKFNQSWLHKSTFSAWLKPVEGNAFEAHCSLCKKTVKLGTLGVKALESHAQSNEHKTNVKSQLQTPAISSVFAPASRPSPLSNAPLASVPAAAVPATTSGIIDLRTTFGSTSTLKAEVLWTLNTVANHQSYNSNNGIGELFRCMLPDSDVAKNFACGGDKTAYVAKFGLAEYIKRDLVAKVNNGPFVIMFDESFNQTTKTKQLDLHVRFWDEGQVRSRYLGSQFLGHATARDLLENIKVSN